MELSVVVPTLNAQNALADCLDALDEEAPEDERIVVNGPSADGTSGMVANRDDVDVLVELADRNVNVARNAGITEAAGDVIAFIDGFTVVQEGWRDALAAAIDDGADVVTGPVARRDDDGSVADAPEHRRIAGRRVTYFDGGNVSVDAGLLHALDGFDEYLEVGGSRDLAHRLAGVHSRTDWAEGQTVERLPAALPRASFGWKYRSLAYRLAKNYGARPSVVWRLVRSALAEGRGELTSVLAGERRPSSWIGEGRDVVVNAGRGTVDGWAARLRDRSDARNPHGLDDRDDRAVRVRDWR